MEGEGEEAKEDRKETEVRQEGSWRRKQKRLGAFQRKKKAVSASLY